MTSFGVRFFVGRSYLRTAIYLAVFTVFYNIIEGVISIHFGAEDETLALFGFGLDSFVEVISGIGIWHMVVRIQKNDEIVRDEFEKRALKITGSMFYILSIGLVIIAIINMYHNHTPDTTMWGIIISVVSIIVMWWLVIAKIKVGKSLNSNAIISDANCTKMCVQLSFVLLVSSIGYELFGIGRIDALGTLIIAYLAFKEGRESFDKAKNNSTCCSSC